MASAKEIKNAVNEVKENLVLNNFKDAMMLMAQISIELIEYLVDDNLIVSKGYEEDLKVLLNNNIIDSRLERNFETMIISGIQAHNGVEIPREHAEKALEVLDGMIKVLIDDRANKVFEKNITDAYKQENKNKQIYEYNEDDDLNNDLDKNSNQPAFMADGEDVDFREKERMRQELISKNLYKPKKKRMNILTLILPIAFIIIVAMLIRSCISNSNDDILIDESELDIMITESETESETEETTTLPPTTTEEGYYISTTNSLRVRSEANSNATILGLLNVGDSIRVIRFINDTWALVSYQGREAFVAREYIRRNEVQTLAPEYNEQ